jgi:hypothetical protein
LAKEAAAMALFDAIATSVFVFGRRARFCAGLTWGYYGGDYAKADGTIEEIANDTITLTASATNYVLETDGVISVTTVEPSGWPAPLAGGARALYEIICDGTGVNPAAWPSGGYKDWRVIAGGGSSVEQAYDIHAFIPGTYTADQLVLRIPVTRDFELGANFAGSSAVAATASTGTVVFDVRKNGSSIGTITFTTSATGTLATSGGLAVSFLAGTDTFSIHAPATIDATLAGVGVALKGTRT